MNEPETRQRGHRTWYLLVFCCAILLLYGLSAGPVRMLVDHGKAPEALTHMHEPLLQSARITGMDETLQMYLGWWRNDVGGTLFGPLPDAYEEAEAVARTTVELRPRTP